MLVDIVSKNGNLLLNVPPRPDGTLDGAHQQHLVGLGKWMRINGEAIYSTRPWIIAEEGPTTTVGGHFSDGNLGLSAKDIRFTRSKDGKTLFAILMGWPGDGAAVTIRSLATTSTVSKVGKAKIAVVSLLGHDGDLKWSRDAESLKVVMPQRRPCEHAFSIKIEFA